MLVIDDMGRRAIAREICTNHTPRQLEEILSWCDLRLRPFIERHLQRVRKPTTGTL
jgi:hypothetical protein